MQMDVNQIKEALTMLERSNGIQESTALEALKEGIVKAYKREIGIDEMPVELVFDLDKGIIELYRLYAVVREVEDEYLEISLEDANANKEGKVYGLGDYYPVQADLKELRSATLRSIKSIFSQKIKEVEKGNLYETFKDKIGTMITGKVETIDDRGASVNVSGTSIFLPRREMIGDETFTSGQSIKLFVNKVDNTKKLQIDISRSCPGFLEALFKEEIPDVYNGNIIIKKVARQAGERSKVAVYSPDPNVDPAGACIGPNGSRVQKIVSSLGNGENKEKVDVIQYSENPALFIVEALKPARVAGIKVDEEAREATVVVKDDSLSLAIGRKGVNVRLAVTLTGYKIDILTEEEATEEEFEYTSFEELQAIAMALKAERISQLQKEELAKQASNANGALPGLPEGYVAPQQRIYEAEKTDIDMALEIQSEEEDIEAAPVIEEEPVVEESKEEEAPSIPEEKEEPEFTEVKTTTSLSDLEASLEADSKRQNNQKQRFNKKKKDNAKEEAEEKPSVQTNVGPQMSIYTEEELKAFEEEEQAESDYVDDEDVNYDDYDDYYDEDR